MLQPAELTLDEMGELAAIIPAADPEVQLHYQARFPTSSSAMRRSIIPVCEPTWAATRLKYVTAGGGDKLDLVGRQLYS